MKTLFDAINNNFNSSKGFGVLVLVEKESRYLIDVVSEDRLVDIECDCDTYLVEMCEDVNSDKDCESFANSIVEQLTNNLTGYYEDDNSHDWSFDLTIADTSLEIFIKDGVVQTR